MNLPPEPTSSPWPPSLWAAVTPPGPALSQLVGTHEADVCVIGAGFTGLSAALHLAKAGKSVIVVEAAEPGWGASGRNNGQVIPTLSRADPDAIIARHGEAGERFVHLIRDSAQGLFDLARAEGIDAEAEQTGWVQPVHSPGRMKIAERRVAQWSKHGAKVDLLSRQALAGMIGSEAWFGGWMAPSGGHINPLALVRGLTRSTLRAGAAIHQHTPVTAISRTRTDWVMTMPRARIASKALIVATNTYTDTFSSAILPTVAREVLPVLSWQMATQPLSEPVRARVLPGRPALSDTHGELHFMRYDARHRLVTGGALINPTNGAEKLKPILAARLARLFPGIGSLSFDHVWNGYVGMTRDFLPRFHRIGPDGFAWVGCNGRAVSLSLAIGKEFARGLTGTLRRDLMLPFTDPEPVRLHGLARRLAPLALAKYRWRDKFEV